MSVEFDSGSSTATIAQLNASWPTSTDKKKQGDDHLRLIKRALKNSFPNIDAPVTVNPAELNLLAGLTVPVAEVFNKSNPANLFLNPALLFTDGTNPDETNPVTNTYVAEQWYIRRNNAGGSFSLSLQTPDPGRTPVPGYAMEFNITTALTGGSPFVGLAQAIEDVQFFGNKILALSVEVDNRSSAPRNFTASAEQFFGSGSGASPTVAVGGVEGTLQVPANAGRRLTWHFEMPSISGKVITDPDDILGTYAAFGVYCTTPDVGRFRFGGWHLEAVSSTTQPPSAFTMPSVGEQRAALNRYYMAYEIASTPIVATAVNRAYTSIMLPVGMRTPPRLGTFGDFFMIQPGVGTRALSLNLSLSTPRLTSVSLAFDSSSLTVGYPGLVQSGIMLMDARF